MFNDESISLDDPAPKNESSWFPERIDLGNGMSMTFVDQEATSEEAQRVSENCPYWATPGYEACDGLCVWALVYDEECSLQYIEDCCAECPDGQTCATPVSFKGWLDLVIRLYCAKKKIRCPRVVITSTPCEYEDRGFGSQNQTSFGALLESLIGGQFSIEEIARAAEAPQARLTVQKPDDLTQFRTVRINLDREVIRLRVAGWWLVLSRLQIPQPNLPFPSPVPVMQYPPVTPTQQFELGDVAASASILLPEQGGYKQHWVTVPDNSKHPIAPYRYTTFSTAEWSVLLLREPIPTVQRKSDCGCCGQAEDEPFIPSDVPPASNS